MLPCQIQNTCARNICIAFYVCKCFLLYIIQYTTTSLVTPISLNYESHKCPAVFDY